MREKYGTVQRIFWIMKELARHGKFTTEEYLDRFNVTVRTMSEDLRHFRDLMADWFQNATDEENPKAQLVCKDSKVYRLQFKEYFFFGFGDTDLRNFYPFVRSLQKTPSLLPFPVPELMKEIEENAVGPDTADLADRIVYKTYAHDTLPAGLLEVIMEGIMESRKISFKYAKADGEESQRIVEAIQIINYGGEWYLLADQGQSRFPHLFKISRISDPKITDQKYRKKLSREQAKNDFMDVFGIYLGGSFKEGRRRVTIRFWGADTVNKIKDRKYHESQTFTKGRARDGGIYGDLSVYVWHYDEILAETLGWGGNAEALEPEDFRQAWIEKIKGLNKRAKL